ncbi:amidohydrolase [Streptomyces sp. ET3-23]|uniref:amidohydrolase family protein n=1 Tax=Streptomyces sp. ET3-23 TaxID=2885643 RepID=UPI001D12C979|nr:amidohydrolase family protein [Streptomyces sp. ET3-23]MCC2278321.1 amidohydrolase [Streptomyces sp. ET3-23]
MESFPTIISVDDHTVEPPDVWRDRLPAKFRDAGPRIVRAPIKEMTFLGGRFAPVMGAPGDAGPVADWWVYEDLHRPLTRLDTAVGYSRDDIGLEGITYEEMRPGSFSVPERLADMDANHVQSALCFPTFPRFCGQTFTEAADRELALLCVRAYNDWMTEEWCGPAARGRLIPLAIVPLWDAELAAQEVRRNAARGVRALCFSEIPPYLGLPSVHTDAWDPFLRACDETGTVVAMHIGSSSRMPSTSEDAPPAVSSALTFANCCFSMTDWLMSGAFTRFPDLRLMYAEGQIGWIPYILERADTVWENNRKWGGIGDKVLEPPSELFAQHIHGCFFDDAFGLRNLDAIGVGNVLYETDYPHSDSTWPRSREVAEEQMGHLTPDVVERIVRGNAIELLGLTPDGLWAGAPARG